MTHYQDEDLILYYYGEGRGRAAVDAHLGQCERCSAAYKNLAATLQMVPTPEIPERGDQYGLEVWHEKFGTQSRKIKLDPKASLEVEFKFSSK